MPYLVVRHAQRRPTVSSSLTAQSGAHSMSKLRWLIAMLLAVAFVPPSATAQERATVTGQVLEAGTQRPLPGVQIAIPVLRISTQTDEDGRFVLSVPRGSHRLQASVIGYRVAARELSVTGSGATL